MANEEREAVLEARRELYDKWKERVNASLQVMRSDIDRLYLTLNDLAKETGELRNLPDAVESLRQDVRGLEAHISESIDELGAGLGDMFSLGATVLRKRNKN